MRPQAPVADIPSPRSFRVLGARTLCSVWTLFALLISVGFSFLPVPVLAQTSWSCRFNNQPRRCSVREAHREPVRDGNHVEILWADGDETTVRFLMPSRPGNIVGMEVLINGATRGRVEAVQALACGARGCRGLRITIRSSSGNRFSYTRFDGEVP